MGADVLRSPRLERSGSMSYEAYIAAYPPIADKRAALAVERTIHAIERLIGEPLALTPLEWAKLIAVAPQFTEHEWTTLRLHGRAVVDSFIGRTVAVDDKEPALPTVIEPVDKQPAPLAH